MDKTVFVLVTDEMYLYKAKMTIIDLRSRGQWHGDLVLINLNISNLNKNCNWIFTTYRAIRRGRGSNN